MSTCWLSNVNQPAESGYRRSESGHILCTTTTCIITARVCDKKKKTHIFKWVTDGKTITLVEGYLSAKNYID